MATTIYKTSQYVRWDATGNVITSSKNLGGSAGTATDLSNYYTKIDLQTSGDAEVHFDNITNAYHNHLLGLEGGSVADSGESSGTAGEYYHLSYADYVKLFLNKWLLIFLFILIKIIIVI